MHAVRVTRASAQSADLSGRVLCHELRSDDGRVAIAKGRVLDDADSRRALELPWTELHLLALDSDDDARSISLTGTARLPALHDGTTDVEFLIAGLWPDADSTSPTVVLAAKTSSLSLASVNSLSSSAYWPSSFWASVASPSPSSSVRD